MRIEHNPKTVHDPLAAYTHGIEISGAQRWLVLSGQIGMDVVGNLPRDPLEQFRIALTNIECILEDADMDIGDIVKLTIYLVGEMDSVERRQILYAWLKGHKPSMTLLYISALASPEMRVEIEALASTTDG
jgi:enamine deaminase RidA (YjgF/YER057c/UK114 family)